MSKYSLRSLDIPLILGDEETYIFERKITSQEMKSHRYVLGTKETGNIFSQYELGSSNNEYKIFARYSNLPNIYEGWSAGGFIGVPDGLILSGITDNSLIISGNKWWLLSFNPVNRNIQTTFYIYKKVLPEQPGKENYGLNLYNKKGRLIFNSSWKVARILHYWNPCGYDADPRMEYLPMGRVNGATSFWDFYTSNLNKNIKVPVPSNALVSIGLYNEMELLTEHDHYPVKGYLAPIIINGFLTLSPAHYLGGPHNLINEFGNGKNVSGVSHYVFNPIIVIENPE